MKHALVIGGTGMLKNTTLWLTEQGYHVSVIARNSNKMKRLMMECNTPNFITPILLDYKNSEELKEQLMKLQGKIDLVVAWIHSDAPDALGIVTSTLASDQEKWELYHVLGSSANISDIKKNVQVPENCSYHQVQLGFILQGESSRWLTNEEISSGVIAAIESGRAVSVVGVLEPWEKRP
ncbi:short-chain dehydrogenase [Sutcliffiella halmapala]|uniref:short-chain dehydrogenase n=1 Tax=Sutcliffiella halmapala TaxID=79882 RepID=UPI000994BD54|nr:short-chain dehydrogenase [Sutcliffiella halmapala]